MYKSLKLFLLLLPAMPAATGWCARPENTSRGKRLVPAAPVPASAPVAASDTLPLPSDTLVRVAGYNKPLTASVETMLVTNLTDGDIESICLTIDYKDMQGRQLHSVTREISHPIPSGSTRMVSIPSWDRQHAYYYHKGKAPRASRVTPYDVNCRVEYCVIKRSPLSTISQK